MTYQKAPVQLERFENNPILSPGDNDWESYVVTNPAAWEDKDTGKIMMLYRACGEDDKHVVRFGLAESDDGYHFSRLSDEPAFGPSVDGFDAGCVEDPRVIQINDWFAITYAVRPFAPGKYWLPYNERPWKQPELPDFFPKMFRENLTATGLAFTKDFKSYIRAGSLTSPSTDDRDAILFPEQIDGKWWMLHRPMGWTGEGYGTNVPAMWIKSSQDLLDWEVESKLLMTSKYEWEGVKVGGNTPPIRTQDGWLTLYHSRGHDTLYRVGAVLLHPDNPSIVLHRSKGWIMEPETDYERNGCYAGGGVCFPCGKVIRGDELLVYYGGADKYVGGARCSVSELIAYLKTCPA